MENTKAKTGYVSLTTDEIEEAILTDLTSVAGSGRATVIKRLLREYGPAMIADLKKKLSIHADANPSNGEDNDNKADTLSQE